MRKLFLRMVVFLALALGINAVLYSFLPHHWQNYRLEQKFDVLENDFADSVTTILVGSSRIFRSFNPLVIEEALAAKGLKANLFNMGFSATRPIEQSFMIDRIYNFEYPELKYIIIELQTSVIDARENLYTARNNYVITGRLFNRYWSWVSHQPMMFAKKVYFLSAAVLSNFEQVFSVGYIYDLSDYLIKKTNAFELGIKGHVPLKVEELLTGNNAYAKRIRILERDTPYLMQNANKVAGLHSGPSTDKINPKVVDYHLNLIQRFEHQGVKVVYLIPPRMNTDSVLIATSRKIPKSNIIDLNNFLELPPLTEFRYWADKGHLNETGSIIISGMMADSLALKMTEP